MSQRSVPTRNAAAPLIVHSHLRWDFVWQRPQQLLSRLAATQPVLFVEEPVFVDETARGTLQVTEPYAGVTRVVPHLPSHLRDHYDDAIVVVRTLVREAVGEGGPLAGRFDRAVQWFYTPMPVPAMLGAFGERGVVYDCMDELAQFRFAPTELGHRERMLLHAADVVFTGGHKLYQSKSRYHENVHFFGCGVDVQHFGKARLEETALPEDIRDIARPIMGYFGVVDERLDYRLLRALAEANPDCSLVMIGPVVKVDPAELPRAANIHWLGQKSYADLPAYLKAFDVCLMPFALNEATEYINPTKTLEYMAAGKPIVSTAVADVVRNFVPIVRVAESPMAFADEVRSALSTSSTERVREGIERAAHSSWDAIVTQMRALIANAVRGAEPEAIVSRPAARPHLVRATAPSDATAASPAA
ncbi:MAG: glycosyltransferase [Gemmatimonadota bacterium]|nr:glycosyltransferase [Gemmatimonadota bacterium]